MVTVERRVKNEGTASEKVLFLAMEDGEVVATFDTEAEANEFAANSNSSFPPNP